MLQPTPGSRSRSFGSWLKTTKWFFMFGRHIHKWFIVSVSYVGFSWAIICIRRCIHYVFIHTFLKQSRHVLGTWPSKFPHCWSQKLVSPKKAKEDYALHGRSYWQWDTLPESDGGEWPPPQTRDFTDRNIWSFQLSGMIKKMYRGQDWQLCGYCLVKFEGI